MLERFQSIRPKRVALRNAEQHVLQGAEMGNEVEFLMDEREARPLGGLRRALAQLLAADGDPAAIGER